MKRIVSVIFVLLFCVFLPYTIADAEQPEKALTLMVYMCGSNLESQNGSASSDIEEMLQSEYNLEQVNVILMTGGSVKWEDYGYSGKTTISTVNPNYTLRDVGQQVTDASSEALDMGDPATLSMFLDYGIENYPAEKYALILWDHGAGPLDGVCLDELHGNNRLSISELAGALGAANIPGKLSWIGFDACLMGTAEVAQMVSPYAEYMIASQDTEPAYGWNYVFLKDIEEDADGAATGIRIVDTYFEGAKEGETGLTLSCLDLSKISDVITAMDDFFSPVGRSMNETTFAMISNLRTSSTNFGKAIRAERETGYDLVDLGDLLLHYTDVGNTWQIRNALNEAVVYSRSSEKGITGLSVYHPLRNKQDYLESWANQYKDLPFSEGYKKYLDAFGTLLLGEKLADWSSLVLSDDGFDEEGGNIYSLLLSEEQRQNFASAKLLVFGAFSNYADESIYSMQFENEELVSGDIFYFPVWESDVLPDEENTLNAAFYGKSLYITDETGNAVAGPISYEISDDGQQWYVFIEYRDQSGRENLLPPVKVMYTCVPDMNTGEISIINTEVYDPVTSTYTPRIAFSEENFTEMFIDRQSRRLPETDGILPGVDEWEKGWGSIEISLPLKWQLRIIDEQLSGTTLYAAIQITDVQQNCYCTPLVRIQNPNLYDIGILPRTITGDGYEITIYAVLDNSLLTPGLSIGVEFRNTSFRSVSFFMGEDALILNQTRTAEASRLYSKLKPTEVGYDNCHISSVALTGMQSITEISFSLHMLSEDRSISVEIPISCQLENCIISSVASSTYNILGSFPGSEVTWELIELKENNRNGISGVLHVENHSGSTLRINKGSVIINDFLQSDSIIQDTTILQKTDGFLSFEFQNRALSEERKGLYTIETATSELLTLNEYRLLERYGVSEIRKLGLFLSFQASSLRKVNITLTEPFRLKKSEPGILLEPIEETSNFLLIGNISVSADRILAGNDVIIKSTIHNNTDRDIVLTVKDAQVDGHGCSFIDTQINLGAHAMCVKIFYINTDAFESVDLAFRYDGYTSNRAHIQLKFKGNAPKELADERFAPEFEVVAVTHGLDSMKPSPEFYRDNECEVSISMSLKNDENASYEENHGYEVTSYRAASITLQINNLSGKGKFYSFYDFVINDRRVIPGMCSIDRGGSKYVLEIKDEDLTNITEITSLSFTMSDGSKEKIIRFDIIGGDLKGNTPLVKSPLAETVNENVAWKLLYLENTVRKEIQGLLCIRNDSQNSISYQNIQIFMEGIHTGGEDRYGRYDPKVEGNLMPGMERIIKFSYSNSADLDNGDIHIGGGMFSLTYYSPYHGCVLQSYNIQRINYIRIVADGETEHGSFRDIVDLKLADPLVLEKGNDNSKHILQNERYLLQGEVSIGISYLLLGDKEIALTLSIQNNSDLSHSISLKNAYAGEKELQYSTMTKKVYYLPPHTKNLVTKTLKSSDYKEDQKNILEEIHLSFEYDGVMYKDACIWPDIPMLLGSAQWITSEHLYVKPASLSIENSEHEFSENENSVISAKPVINEEELFFSFDFVIVNKEDGSFMKPEVSGTYIEDLGDEQVYEPALKIVNETDEDYSPKISAIINGELCIWDDFTVPKGYTWWSYWMGDTDGIGIYECSFFANGIEVCTGTLEIMERGDLISYSVGETVFFGSYEQDNIVANGPEPIEWIVLEVEDGKALLVSRYALDCKPYHREDTPVTWETCSLRTWLNKNFLREAFSGEEQGLIASYECYADDNPDYGTDPGNDTQDKVFLLSIPEVEYYFETDEDRRCYGTVYCYAQGAHEYGEGTCWWWLRTPGEDQDSAATVKGEGKIDVVGGAVNVGNIYEQASYGAVRPALVVDFDSANRTESEEEKNRCPECKKENVSGVDFCIFCGTQITETTPVSEQSSNFSVPCLEGDIVIFGNYEQDNDLTNGKEPIEWIVLETKSDRALLISRYALDGQRYNSQDVDVTWEKSTIRAWLNTRFIRDAFSEEEQKRIIYSTVSADKNPDYLSVNVGDETIDKLFLLSFQEADKYFSSDEMRICVGSPYCFSRGAYQEWKTEYCWWWLRTQGETGNSAAYVHAKGSISSEGLNDSVEAVRPAMWILY